MSGLDHEERFLFREEMANLAAALSDGAVLDNVEDLLVDLITSSHFNAEVVTLERSLQAMLGLRQGAALVMASGEAVVVNPPLATGNYANAPRAPTAGVGSVGTAVSDGTMKFTSQARAGLSQPML